MAFCTFPPPLSVASPVMAIEPRPVICGRKKKKMLWWVPKTDMADMTSSPAPTFNFHYGLVPWWDVGLACPTTTRRLERRTGT